MTVGDFRQTNLPQDVNSQYGKTLRINKTDGSYEILSLGHRNPQGLTINPITGALWAHEHGPRGGDEINLPEKGKNYGWPKSHMVLTILGQKLLMKPKKTV